MSIIVVRIIDTGDPPKRSALPRHLHSSIAEINQALGRALCLDGSTVSEALTAPLMFLVK